jgi:phenylacetate-coenzyme A ligase PaaK-like adenylate-forming protein
MSTPTATRDDAFMFDRSAETMSRDALAALQMERTKRTLEHAYANVRSIASASMPPA